MNYVVSGRVEAIPFKMYFLSINVFFLILKKTMVDILAQNRSGWTNKGSQTLHYSYDF